MAEQPQDPDQWEADFLRSLHQSSQEEDERMELAPGIPNEGSIFRKRRADRTEAGGTVYDDVREVYECQYCRTIIEKLAADRIEKGQLVRGFFLRECKHEWSLFGWLPRIFLWWLWNGWRSAAKRSPRPRRLCGKRVCEMCYRLSPSGRGFCPDHARRVLVTSSPGQQRPGYMGVSEHRRHLIGRFFRAIGRGLATLLR